MRFSISVLLLLATALQCSGAIPDAAATQPAADAAVLTNTPNEENCSDVDATTTDKGSTEDTIASVQTLMEKLSVSEVELKAKLAELQSSVASSKVKLQESASAEEFEDAARLKLLLAKLATDIETAEMALAVTKSQLAQASDKLKQLKVRAIRASMGDMHDPVAIIKEAKAAYKARYEKQLNKWAPVIDAARVVVQYIARNAIESGVRELEIGHFITFTGLKDMARKLVTKLKRDEKLYSIAEILQGALKQAGYGELSIARDDLDGGFILEANRELFPNSAQLSQNLVQRSPYSFIQDISNGLRGTVVVKSTSDAIAVIDVGLIGPCKSQYSCFKLSPIYADSILVSLDNYLFELHQSVSPFKISYEHGDLFETYVTFDGVLVDGFSMAALTEIFPSGDELAAFNQALANPQLLRAVLFDFREHGLNVSSSKRLFAGTEKDLKMMESQYNFKVAENRSNMLRKRVFNCGRKCHDLPTSFTDFRDEYFANNYYLPYITDMFFSEKSIIDTALHWNLWHPLPAGDETIEDWLKDDLPLILKAASSL